MRNAASIGLGTHNSRRKAGPLWVLCDRGTNPDSRLAPSGDWGLHKADAQKEIFILDYWASAHTQAYYPPAQSGQTNTTLPA